MTKVSIPAPSIALTSFACPHCGAHATQHWFHLLLKGITGEHPVPVVLSAEELDKLDAKLKTSHDPEKSAQHQKWSKHFRRLLQGEPFIGEEDESVYKAPRLDNVFVSRCYTCRRLALWLHDRLLYPSTMTGPSPNTDLSEDVMRDYEEARTILDLSPRGAAALLRLAVEKICIELGAEGDNINQRIADLVSKGLPEEVQQALDALRVIGNEAVHPGQLDLRDDRGTAVALFDLVNFIAEDRITRPKQRGAIYNMIPEGKRKQIDARNAKALDKPK